VNGAQSLLGTLLECGVEVCFGNPGTSELPLVAALDSSPGIRPVLCLFEGVATGAADGYGRVAGKPAATLLHLGPGLANGLANLHNARRAATPVVNIVGDHATHHVRYDSPLNSDVVGLARTVSSWVCESRSAKTLASDTARAVQAARAPPGGVATLIVPADAAWGDADRHAKPLPDIPMAQVASDAIDAVAARIRRRSKSALLLRGPALRGASLEAAGRIQAKTGMRLLCDTFAPRTELGAGSVPLERIPYFVEQIVEFLQGLELIVLVGAEPPVSFFAYPGKPSRCLPADCECCYLARPHEDGVAALLALADALQAPPEAEGRTPLRLPEPPTGPLDAMSACQIMAALTPENAILADDAVTSRHPLLKGFANARPFTHLPLTGGAIGQGLPVAVGAALAAPGRKIVCAHGDGAAAYTMQALWSMARERLDVTTVIFANRSYAILKIELQRLATESLGPKALSMLDLSNPELRWVQIANGFGVEASRATTCAEFLSQYSSAMKAEGPTLIEVVL
jgi:acetolactate synthase I/II/III large subunit